MTAHPSLFDRCGGTRAMAEIVGEAPSTVQSWKTARRIPAGKQPEVIERVNRAGIPITAEDVVWPFGRPSASHDQPPATGPAEERAA
ncbi:carph-isopro domain-containing protein [Sphingobium sp. HDIP04]|uniref:carph-isopro domain-containing protein n=1 Tax=Sphingobium sp. HDIP04 TaxID=428994 RepID=UPI003FCF005A